MENTKTAEEKCQLGCKSFTGSEIKHNKDCIFYPESFSKMYDDAKKTIELLQIRDEKKEVRCSNLHSENGRLYGTIENLKKRIEELEAGYTERELEIAYCIGLLNRVLTIDELSEELKTAKEKLANLKQAIKRGDFNIQIMVNPSTNGK